jgi:uncharacterized protein YcaQ
LLDVGNTGDSKKDLLKVIERLGYVQIDTISIVERAHKHVLWTRFPAFSSSMLDELVEKDKKVFEFWDHAAAYIPMKYFRFSLRRKLNYGVKYKHWARKNRKILQYVKDRITAEGPLQSRDFEQPGQRGAWWDWKPAKDALEFLFHTGELVVRARKSFQKVYDLPERYLPKRIDTSIPTEEEHSEHLIMKEINSNGFASLKEVTYLRRHHKDVTRKVLDMLTESRKIIPVKIEGTDGMYYSTKKILKELDSKKDDKHIHILSPFDNLVIQRKRLSTLFNFDYTIECYLPAPKRKYGYFVLPVLYGDRFIARLDAKADRTKGELKVINLFVEEGVKFSKKTEKAFEVKLMELAKFAGCHAVANLK